MNLSIIYVLEKLYTKLSKQDFRKIKNCNRHQTCKRMYFEGKGIFGQQEMTVWYWGEVYREGKVNEEKMKKILKSELGLPLVKGQV